MRLAYILRLGHLTKRFTLRTDADIPSARAALRAAPIPTLPMPDPVPPTGFKRAEARMLRRRIVTGVICGLLFPSIALLPKIGIIPYGLPFALVIAFFSGIAANELYRAVRRQGSEPTEVLGYAACLLFNLFAWRREGRSFDPYLPAVLVAFVVTGLLVELGKRRQKPTSNLGTTLLGAIYVGWLSSFVTLLHGADTPLIHAPIAGTHSGAWLVIYVGIMTWGADTAALFVGRSLGRHKLAPAISPGKTWEGAVGGFAASVLLAVAFGAWFQFPWRDAVGLGILIGVFGLIGDLCASVLKRDLGLKDFGVLLPGHGGVLDRIDSIILTAPLAYYFLSLFLPRH